MRSNLRKWLRLLLIVVVVLLIDQVSKRWVITNLPYEHPVQPIPALAPYFQLTYTQNTGAAFGFLPGGGNIFLIIAIVVSVLMIIFYPRVEPDALLMQIGMSMVMGGALGNAADRIQYGGVIDFIHYQIPGVISNVSNLADHAIVGGVLILFVLSWRSDLQRPDDPHPQDTPKAGDETTPGSV